VLAACGLCTVFKAHAWNLLQLSPLVKISAFYCWQCRLVLAITSPNDFVVISKVQVDFFLPMMSKANFGAYGVVKRHQFWFVLRISLRTLSSSIFNTVLSFGALHGSCSLRRYARPIKDSNLLTTNTLSNSKAWPRTELLLHISSNHSKSRRIEC
jgi:hypothetical protein